MSDIKTNHLINETSPYLLQHAHNPVDWYPWGEEALEKAKQENKPIFLSIGYSACHWCHVMEHESFEDDIVAQALNENFVSIKVDREERPDLDDIYMTVVQAMTGSGGWPMTVFMTPDQKPFFAGTYFPKNDRYGKPGFLNLVRQMHDVWETQPEKVAEVGGQVVKELQRQLGHTAAGGEIPLDLRTKSWSSLIQNFDEVNGGFGEAPKFPPAMTLDNLVDLLYQKSNTEAQHVLDFTLKAMAQGGIYDQIGGGFHRYSTDAHWLVPHFEKMLYDNALLASTYAEASKVVSPEFNARIAAEIGAYVLKEMTHENGAFFSTTDADSEKVEGKFFVWDRAEILEGLGKKEGSIFCEIYNIDAAPAQHFNFDGGTPSHDWFHGRIPHLKQSVEDYMSIKIFSWEQLLQWKKSSTKSEQRAFLLAVMKKCWPHGMA